MSKKRKGMSADDKQRTVLSIYHEKLEPFNLKEIESLASKAGVVQQTVKDINQMLVDDFLVYTDKIGAANIYWSFPSKTFKDREVMSQRLERELAALTSKSNTLTASIEEEKTFRNDPDRQRNLEVYQQLLDEKAALDVRLEAVKNNDPVEVDRVLKLAKKCKESAHRWVDNIWCIKSFLVKKKGMSGKEADKILRIEGDFDYDDFTSVQSNLASKVRKGKKN